MPSLISEHQQWFDSATGELLVNGNVYIGVAGLDPEVLANQLTIYSDRALTTAIANPQTTDANGQTSNKIWIAGNYSLAVTNSALVVKYSELDNGDVGLLVQSEEQTATEGQTLITLANITYATSAGNVLAYINGVKQAPSSFTETSSSSITFTEGLNAGDLVEIITGSSITSATVIGSDLITYLPAGTGAVQTNVQAKLRESISVTDFGAVGDGVTDDTAAIQSAIDYVVGIGGGEVFFPTGRYITSSALTVRGDGVTLRGENTRGSAIRVTNTTDNGILVEHPSSPGSSFLNNFNMSDMSVRAQVETTAGAALVLNKCQQVYINNVSLEDHFGGIDSRGGLAHYMTNINIYSARAAAPVSWASTKTGSFHYKFDTSTDGQHMAGCFITNLNCRRNDTNDLVEHSLIINAVDGLWIANSHFMGVGSYDCIVTASGSKQITGIKFTGVWFDNNSNRGISVSGTTSASFGRIHLDGCNFLTQTDIGIYVDSSATGFQGIRMTGGSILKSNTAGVLLGAGRKHSFVGVEFGACNTSAAAASGGVSITGDTNVLIEGCQFDETALGVTSTSMEGIRIASGGIGNIVATGNTFDLTDLDISDQGTVDTRNFSNNFTTKSVTATAISGTSLLIPENGDVISVANGLNFNQLVGRWNNRIITLVFLGSSTVTHVNNQLMLNGAVNMSAVVDDTLTLLYDPFNSHWREISRTV